MDYKNLIHNLEMKNEPLCSEAAEAIKILAKDNYLLQESYDAMFRDLKREKEKKR